MRVHEWESHEISNNTGRREILAMTIVGSWGNDKEKTTDVEIQHLKEKAGNVNRTNQQDQRSGISRTVGGDTPHLTDHLVASRDCSGVSELVSTLMFNLVLYLYTICISHTHNCCVFLSWIYPPCTGPLSMQWTKMHA